jgi:hypothetical protein
MMIAMIGSIALLLPERAQCRAAAGEGRRRPCFADRKAGPDQLIASHRIPVYQP